MNAHIDENEMHLLVLGNKRPYVQEGTAKGLSNQKAGMPSKIVD